MKRELFLICSALAALITAQAGTPLDLNNPGFEDGLSGWILLEKDLPQPMSAVTSEAAREGSGGLRVDDKDKQHGSSLVSQPIPAQPGLAYRLSFHARTGGSNKGAVYLRFYDASRKIINADKLPSVTIDRPGDWQTYTLDAVAPEAATGLAVWIHTWSGAVGVIDFDDFSIEQVEGVAGAAATPVPAPVAAAPKAGAKRGKPAMIVIKVDDLKVGKTGRMPQAWQKLFDILKARQIKAGIGVICDSLQAGGPEYIQWIKDAKASGLVEFWFHGYAHDVRTENGQEYAEFVGRPYEEQKRRFEESLKLAQEKLGFSLQTFGAPGGGKMGSFDEGTIRAMADVPEMKVWLYPQPIDEPGRQLESAGKVTILDRVWPVNIEQPLFKPNAQKLIDGYNKFPGRPYFVIQGHPAHWDDAGFGEFEKMLDFLIAQGARFVTPTECAEAVSRSAKTASTP